MSKKGKEKKRKKPGQFRSRDKGNNYERHVCEVANYYLKKVTTTIEVRSKGKVISSETKPWSWSRTARSGGWTTASTYGHLRGMRADLTVDHDCPIFPECKNRESWSFDNLLKNGFKGWEPYLWYQEALEKGKQTGHPTVLIFTKNALQAVDYTMMTMRDHITLTGGKPKGECMRLPERFVVVLFTDFIHAFVQHQLKGRG